MLRYGLLGRGRAVEFGRGALRSGVAWRLSLGKVR